LFCDSDMVSWILMLIYCSFYHTTVDTSGHISYQYLTFAIKVSTLLLSCYLGTSIMYI